MKTNVHGCVNQVPLATALTVKQGDKVRYSRILSGAEAAAARGRPKENVFRFGPMFPNLGAGSRLPDLPATGKQLFDLAQSMNEGNGRRDRDSRIPAIYTYLGQFIDHDITKTETLTPALGSNMEAAFHVVQAGRSVSPLSQDDMALLINKRMPALNLDSVLSSAAPRDDKGAMVVGAVTAVPGLSRPVLPFTEPAALADLHDLPRNPPISTNEELDRRALIGDPRNDENLVVAQLHVAFLRAHRRLVHDRGLTGPQADLELQRLFQAIVVQDFLPTVCDPKVVEATLKQKEGVFYRPTKDDPYMPLEFAVAAYRFGHSMVRNAYDYNSEFSGRDGKPIGTLELLFTFTAFSGNMFDAPDRPPLPTLPHNWIIDWSRWIARPDGSTANPAKQVDTLLAGELAKLPQHQGVIGGTDVNVLAVRNLVRGYLLNLPTGQAVAEEVQKKLGDVVTPITPKQIRDVARAAGDAQLAALTAGGFDTKTPLWYYMLAEAAHVKHEGGHLGPIASAIISDVLIQLVRLADGNYLDAPDWTPCIPVAKAGRVELNDLLRFAQVLP